MGAVRTGVACPHPQRRYQGCDTGRGGRENPKIPTQGPWHNAAQQSRAGGWQAKAYQFEFIKDKSF